MSNNATEATENDMVIETYGLPDNMMLPLLVLGNISSILSLLGSGCVVYMARRDMADQVLQRLLFCLSLSDMITSLAFLVMPHILPPEVGYLTGGGTGSFAACSSWGFLFATFQATGVFYNCYLSIYYLAVVRYQWKDKSPRLSRSSSSSRVSRLVQPLVQLPRWEWLAHILTFLLPLSFATVAVAKDAINPFQLLPLCHIATYPWGCDDYPDQEGVDYSRCPSKITAALETTAIVVEGMVTVAGLVCTAAVYFTVRKKLRQTIIMQQRYSANSTQEEEDPFEKRIRQVRTQSILYSLVYLNSFIWPGVLSTMSRFLDNKTIDQKISSPLWYTLQLLTVIFGALQGFFNLFIYSRLKIKRWKEVEPDQSLLWAFWQLLQNTPIPRSSAAAAVKRRTQQEQEQRNKNEKHEMETTDNDGDPTGRPSTAMTDPMSRPSAFTSKADSALDTTNNDPSEPSVAMTDPTKRSSAFASTAD